MYEYGDTQVIGNVCRTCDTRIIWVAYATQMIRVSHVRHNSCGNVFSRGKTGLCYIGFIFNPGTHLYGGWKLSGKSAGPLIPGCGFNPRYGHVVLRLYFNIIVSKHIKSLLDGIEPTTLQSENLTF